MLDRQGRNVQTVISKQLRAVGRRFTRLDRAHKAGKHVQPALHCGACQKARREQHRRQIAVLSVPQEAPTKDGIDVQE